MRKIIICDSSVCIGCGLCQVYCAVSHSLYPDDVLKAFKLSKEKPVPRIRVEEEGGTSYALSCRHCQEPECVKSCLTGAMKRDIELGITWVDAEKCVACYTCVVVCPFGAVELFNGSRKIAIKCDLCMGKNGAPACVENCPNEALYVGIEN